MKNEDLFVYKKSDFYEDFISSQKEYYERENADAYFAERFAEKDKEIAELKANVNNVLIQNRELCQALQMMYSAEEYMELQDENTQLKQKLESVQASMYADVVDANMDVRRLKRALWLARAERAKTEHLSKIMYSTLYRDFIAKWVNVERKCRAKAEGV